MPKINGKTLKKQELLRYCGNIDQLACIQEAVLTNGKADGTKIYNIKTGGGLEYSLLPSKCLDISSLSYKGVNISFLSKNGITSEKISLPASKDFCGYMTGGMLFTCGLLNVGEDCVDDKAFHPTHGRIGLTSANNSYARSYWDDDDYVLETGGQMRETSLFAQNLYLTRKITSKLGENEIVINDVLENNSPLEEEFMLLYHFNFGFPFLDEDTKLIFPENIVTPRTEQAKKGLSENDKIIAPKDDFFENVFFRDVKEKENGIATIKLENNRLGIGAYIKYETENLPILTQWKSMQSGDYALGIEPCNCFVKGRVKERENGTLKKIAPFSSLNFNLKIGFYDL